MLFGAAHVAAVSMDKYENGTPFLLWSSVQQMNESDSEFDQLYDNVATKGLVLVPYQNESSTFVINNTRLAIAGSDPALFVNLYPHGTNISAFDNGSVTALSPATGLDMAPDGPGDFRSLVLSTDPDTPGADPTEQYGVVLDGARFCSWGACKPDAVETSQAAADRDAGFPVFWQRCPSSIVAVPGCATMFFRTQDTPQNGKQTVQAQK
ncbi:MAG: hypothetical protein M1838_004614 [Thelocarpon superellum]|nr:MAG: hypothetical protein M1838_004614 [Thelocarpon superellum]